MTNEQIQMIVFKLGDAEFAVPITQAVRIVRLSSAVTRVPRAPDFLEGVINVEGNIVPLVDLNKRFALPVLPYGPKARIIIVETEGQQVGMLVNRVCEIASLPAASVEPPPAMLADINGVYLSGIIRLDDQLLILLNLSTVLTLEEIEELENVGPEDLSA